MQSRLRKMGRHDGIGAGDLPIDGPWRHGSIDGFLRNVKGGKSWPAAGTRDGSSDCFVKIVPIVAAYAGSPQMLERVADVVRVTQNNDLTVAYAQAAARVLERLILQGSSGVDAVRTVAEELYTDSAAMGGAQISEELEQLAHLASSNISYLDGVIAFCGGRYNAVAVS